MVCNRYYTTVRPHCHPAIIRYTLVGGPTRLINKLEVTGRIDLRQANIAAVVVRTRSTVVRVTDRFRGGGQHLVTLGERVPVVAFWPAFRKVVDHDLGVVISKVIYRHDRLSLLVLNLGLTWNHLGRRVGSLSNLRLMFTGPFLTLLENVRVLR